MPICEDCEDSGFCCEHCGQPILADDDWYQVAGRDADDAKGVHERCRAAYYAPAPAGRKVDPLDQFAEWAMTGKGLSPDDVSPAPAAPADLVGNPDAYYAAKGLHTIANGPVSPHIAVALRQAAAMLTRQAEQLQRQAAVCEAADAAKHMLYLILGGMPPDNEHYRPAQVIHGALEDALAALTPPAPQPPAEPAQGGNDA